LYYDKEDFTHKINPNHLLIEVAWEVCNQVGGIYTVIRSKAPAMTRNHRSGHYCMIGPYLNKNILGRTGTFGRYCRCVWFAAANLRKRGYEVIYADWLITGKPRVVLLNPMSSKKKYETF
jgi:glycogen(starch) synthase